VKVHVPEWGCEVWIRTLPLGDLQAWELECLRSKGEGVDEYRTRYLSKCLVDSTGKVLFSNDQLKQLSGKVGARLFKIAQKHNDLDDKEIEEIGKN
ncbi:MAG: hypothetical protein EBX02_07305, partial [Betaproteobacteria bacterium]|nr:hypothetical protein [Betaproteobacteria bacterium]